MIKVVLFDAAGTLIRLPQTVGFHYQLIGRRHGLELVEKEVTEAFQQAWKAMPGRVPSAAPRPDDDKGWWRELVDAVLDRCGARCAPDQQDRYFEALYEHFAQPGVWELFPDAADALPRLHRRFRLAIVSNFDVRLRSILRDLEVLPYFEQVILSSEAGAEKPHPAIFTRALTLLGVASGEAMHVGDDPQMDWAGAEASGLRTFKLDRKINSLRTLCDQLEAFGFG